MTDLADRPEPPEFVPAPPATTLAEARAAVVGSRYLLFEESFSLFDAGGFRPTFTWPALIFTSFWFVYRRMYLEAALIFLVRLILERMFIASVLATRSLANTDLFLLIGFSFHLALAVTGRWLYWKAVDRRLELAMLRFPNDQDRALAWLKSKGGVDPLAVILLVVVQFVINKFWLGPLIIGLL